MLLEATFLNPLGEGLGELRRATVADSIVPHPIQLLLRRLTQRPVSCSTPLEFW